MSTRTGFLLPFLDVQKSLTCSYMPPLKIEMKKVLTARIEFAFGHFSHPGKLYAAVRLPFDWFRSISFHSLKCRPKRPASIRWRWSPSLFVPPLFGTLFPQDDERKGTCSENAGRNVSLSPRNGQEKEAAFRNAAITHIALSPHMRWNV